MSKIIGENDAFQYGEHHKGRK